MLNVWYKKFKDDWNLLFIWKTIDFSYLLFMNFSWNLIETFLSSSFLHIPYHNIWISSFLFFSFFCLLLCFCFLRISFFLSFTYSLLCLGIVQINLFLNYYLVRWICFFLLFFFKKKNVLLCFIHIIIFSIISKLN